MAATEEERLQKIDQQIHRLQAEKKKLKKQRENAARKQRDHAMIVVGTTVMTHFSPEEKARIVGGSDEEIRQWVDSLFDDAFM